MGRRRVFAAYDWKAEFDELSGRILSTKDGMEELYDKKRLTAQDARNATDESERTLKAGLLVFILADLDKARRDMAMLMRHLELSRMMYQMFRK